MAANGGAALGMGVHPAGAAESRTRGLSQKRLSLVQRRSVCDAPLIDRGSRRAAPAFMPSRPVSTLSTTHLVVGRAATRGVATMAFTQPCVV